MIDSILISAHNARSNMQQPTRKRKKRVNYDYSQTDLITVGTDEPDANPTKEAASGAYYKKNKRAQMPKTGDLARLHIGMPFNEGRRKQDLPVKDSHHTNIRQLLFRGMRAATDHDTKSQVADPKAKTTSLFWSGVYCFSKDAEDLDIVIGHSHSYKDGLFNRIRKGYSKAFSYYDELWLKFFVITHPAGSEHVKLTNDYGKKFNKLIMGVNSKRPAVGPSGYLEKQFHKSPNFESVEDSVASAEWKSYKSRSDIRSSLAGVLNRTKDLWLCVVYFSQDAWHITVNDGKRNVVMSDFRVTPTDVQRLKNAADKSHPATFPGVNDALGRERSYPVGLTNHTSGKAYYSNGTRYMGPMPRDEIMGT